MIIVITSETKNEKTGKKETLVSHGVNMETGANVVLPWVTLQEVGAIYNQELGEYVLKE